MMRPLTDAEEAERRSRLAVEALRARCPVCGSAPGTPCRWWVAPSPARVEDGDRIHSARYAAR